MAQWPIFSTCICIAFECEWLVTFRDWVENANNLGELRSPDPKRFVSTEMDESGVELVRLIVVPVEPLFVEHTKLL